MGCSEMLGKCTVITSVTYIQRILSPRVTLGANMKPTKAVVENKRNIRNLKC